MAVNVVPLFWFGPRHRPWLLPTLESSIPCYFICSPHLFRTLPCRPPTAMAISTLSTGGQQKVRAHVEGRLPYKALPRGSGYGYGVLVYHWCGRHSPLSLVDRRRYWDCWQGQSKSKRPWSLRKGAFKLPKEVGTKDGVCLAKLLNWDKPPL